MGSVGYWVLDIWYWVLDIDVCFVITVLAFLTTSCIYLHLTLVSAATQDKQGFLIKDHSATY